MIMADKKRLLTAVLGPHNPEGEPIEAPEEIDAIAQELIEGVANHDVKAVAEALKAAFAIFDSEPHIEGEHLG